MGLHTLSETIGQSGGAIEWSCSKGNKYKFSLLTLQNQSRFERELERKAVESLRNTKDLLDKEEYGLALSEVLKNITNGKYCFGGEEVMIALRTLWGVSTLLSILTGISQDEAGVLLAENSEVSQVIANVVERSFPVGKERKMKAEEQ